MSAVLDFPPHIRLIGRKPQVMVAVNAAWNIFNFRAGLISALMEAGYEVTVVAPPDEYVSRVEALGCRYIALPMDNKGTNALQDFLLLVRFSLLMRRERPDVFLGYTVKPNVFGSLAANMTGVPVINNIAGLGAVFISCGFLNGLVRRLYRLSLRRSRKVFFQNMEDQSMFVAGSLVQRKIVDCLPGSGIDVGKFRISSLPNGEKTRFLLVSRMLWHKGVGEFVAAARILKERGVAAEFCLLGFLNVKNPSAISSQQMDAWVQEGLVTYLGVSDDVRVEMARADCVVLPSYYPEGTPRALLEAAAMGRPILTTDSVGCRDVVDDGVNGFLCTPRDANDLAEKMLAFVQLSADARTEMGLRGRRKVESQFDERIVTGKYLRSISEILSPVWFFGIAGYRRCRRRSFRLCLHLVPQH